MEALDLVCPDRAQGTLCLSGGRDGTRPDRGADRPLDRSAVKRVRCDPDKAAAASPGRERDRSETGLVRRALRDAATLRWRILDRLGPSPVAEDQLIRDLGAPCGTVAPALTELELEGKIARHPGGLLARTP
jgi:predicted Rossmann fold nucleotide-binding protein DprA/Smf involved in DNA uptake